MRLTRTIWTTTLLAAGLAGSLLLAEEAKAPDAGQPAASPATDTTTPKQAANTPAANAPASEPAAPDPSAQDKPAVPDDTATAAPVGEDGPDLPNPPDSPPTVSAIGFEHPGVHCRFLRDGPPDGKETGDAASLPDEDGVADQPPEKQLTSYKTVYADPATLLFTERRFDGLGTFERGYARINGLLRELALVSRTSEGKSEERRYRTLEADPVLIDLSFSVTERQKVLTLVDGTMTLSRGEAKGSSIPVTGLCGPDAANRSVK